MCQNLALASLLQSAKMKREYFARGIYLFFFISPEPLALWGRTFRSRCCLCFRHVVLNPSLLGALFPPKHFRLCFRDFL
jgi:hypothetical protein